MKSSGDEVQGQGREKPMYQETLNCVMAQLVKDLPVMQEIWV